MHGITRDDHEIARWIKENFEIQYGDAAFVKDQPSQEEMKATSKEPALITDDSHLPEPKKKRIVLRLICNKADEGEHPDFINDAWGLDLGEPLFVSANQGTGMHEVFREINSMFSDKDINDYKEKRKQRRVRFNQLKLELADEIKSELDKRNREYDIGQWMKEFEMANGNPEENSDLDEDSAVDPKRYLSSHIAIEKTGVSYDHFLAKSRIKVSVIGKPNVGKSSLINSILHKNRVLVHDKPHTTTDPVGVDFVKEGVKYRLVDTAGLEGSSHLKVE